MNFSVLLNNNYNCIYCDRRVLIENLKHIFWFCYR